MTGRRIIRLLLPAACLALGAAQADFDPHRAYHIRCAESRRVDAVLSVRIDAPPCTAKEWIVIAPAPPAHPTQTLDTLNLNVSGRPFAWAPAEEHSELRRPLLTARIPGRPLPEAGKVDFELHYQFETRARRLIPGRDPQPVEPLTAQERAVYLRSSDTTDAAAHAVQEWLTRRGLRRGSQEADLAFAYRALRTLATHARYQPNPTDWRPSATCVTERSDCGGLCLLFVAALRANGVPARTLWGRWTKSQEGDYGQWHVKSESYAQGIGWVPVEVSGAVARSGIDVDDCFGRDAGDFLTVHVDTDMEIDTLRGGRERIGWRQGVLWWPIFEGPCLERAEVETWTVHRR